MILKLKLNPDKEDGNLDFIWIHILAIVPEGFEELYIPPPRCKCHEPKPKYQMTCKYMCLTDRGLFWLMDEEIEYAIDSKQYIIDTE